MYEVNALSNTSAFAGSFEVRWEAIAPPNDRPKIMMFFGSMFFCFVSQPYAVWASRYVPFSEGEPSLFP